tara:strand:+ start:18429 stop:18734 length:306 start_codon:yes stop_codon:yes gene_type:complete
MIAGIKKHRKFEKTKLSPMEEIAEKVTLEDQIELQTLMTKIRKDARGRFMYSQKDALALLPLFNKYIDSKVGKNIFGCGGCVTKVLQKMQQLNQLCRNQTK